MLEIRIMNRTNIFKLSEFLEKEKSVEFKYNNLFYQIDESSYGGLCSGSASDAVWFMV